MYNLKLVKLETLIANISEMEYIQKHQIIHEHCSEGIVIQIPIFAHS
jgi:hypothetical protein